MLVEKSRAEAIKAFLSGRRVNVLTEFEDGSMAVESIEAILSEEDTRYLVDVPAVEDPEFRQAMKDMIRESEQCEIERFPEARELGKAFAESMKDAVESAVEVEVLSPPSRGRRQNNLRPENQKRN